MQSITRRVQVIITKDIDIEMTPEMFGDFSEQAYLAAVRGVLSNVESLDDIAKYAAELAATGYEGMSMDGIGLLLEHGQNTTRSPGVKFNIIDESIESEIMGNGR